MSPLLLGEPQNRAHLDERFEIGVATEVTGLADHGPQARLQSPLDRGQPVPGEPLGVPGVVEQCRLGRAEDGEGIYVDKVALLQFGAEAIERVLLLDARLANYAPAPTARDCCG